MIEHRYFSLGTCDLMNNREYDVYNVVDMYMCTCVKYSTFCVYMIVFCCCKMLVNCINL